MEKRLYYIEEILPRVRIYHQVRKVLLQKKTKFQNIQIFDLFNYGKSLVIDGLSQSSEKDEWIYHECLIHPALISQPVNKNLEILVLGAGEGATLREILKYKNIKKITAVDIDQEAVEIFKKFFPEIHQGSFNNPKVDLIFDSAENFLKKGFKKYDIIFSDITEVNYFNLGSKIKKSQLDFYRLVYQRLKKNGLFVMHVCGFSELDYKDYFQIKKIVKKVFPKVYSYRTFVPFFASYWGFLISSTKLKFNPYNISEKTIKKKIKQQNLEKKLKYFSPEIYKTIFVLPPYLKKMDFN